jgi:serine/threonine protein kinase
MCEVYRARDTRLKGDVALETLPESFWYDPDSLARFQREGKRFLVIRSGTDLNGTSAQLIVVQHFDQELSRIVPSK